MGNYFGNWTSLSSSEKQNAPILYPNITIPNSHLKWIWINVMEQKKCFSLTKENKHSFLNLIIHTGLGTWDRNFHKKKATLTTQIMMFLPKTRPACCKLFFFSFFFFDDIICAFGITFLMFTLCIVILTLKCFTSASAY